MEYVNVTVALVIALSLLWALDALAAWNKVRIFKKDCDCHMTSYIWEGHDEVLEMYPVAYEQGHYHFVAKMCGSSNIYLVFNHTDFIKVTRKVW